jgi:hypothetical protein
MLTLDALARMATRMPTEPAGDAGRPPYRRGDPDALRRAVALPSVADETRRALGLFLLVVGTATTVVAVTGTALTHGWRFAQGEAGTLLELGGTALWFALWTALIIGPLAAVGLVREVRRFAKVRRAIGADAWLDVRGELTSLDGSCRRQLGS